ncbi:hypothetical protein B9Z55_012317 [Caenorhabditis nigoni]|uniref:F-box domain-containing protein n=1 Tax=Caenorhabditis nigoni TaxID=1611254 RepID=A0A2G5TWN7_9PELO|nr:hypothetical protein B9Z55_012317 [Caenorhabditis nigoni]
MKFLEQVLACLRFSLKGKLPEKSKSKSKNRFPLLNLPKVVLLECIENLDVLEIIIFSLLSKRVKSIAKLIRWNPLEIRLTSGRNPQIWLKLPTHPGLEWIIDYEKEKEQSSYPYFLSHVRGPQAIQFFVLKDNGIDDVKQMVEHICEVFRSPIFEFHFLEESLIEWIIKFQPTIRHAWICKDVISVKNLDRISKSLEVTDCFGFSPVELDMTFQITEPIPCPSISIWNSFWLTLPAILNGTNSHILLYDSNLTAMDINTILTEWQLGNKLQSLEYLKIHTTALLNVDIYINEVFKDLNVTVSVGNHGRPRTVKLHDEETVKLIDVEMVVNLTRSDGMILSIFEHGETYEGETTKNFLNLQVWRQQT